MWLSGNINVTVETSGTPTRSYADTTWKIGIAAPGWSVWAWAADANIADVRLYNRF